LLDDPLSAVDSQVGRELYENLFRGYLRDKAIVFVNNQIQFLPRCDRIVYMKSGEIQVRLQYVLLDSVVNTDEC
jgi:ABC-type transport system involved in cytochrome bd biosynthesis fused ATPase/permease subunit